MWSHIVTAFRIILVITRGEFYCLSLFILHCLLLLSRVLGGGDVLFPLWANLLLTVCFPHVFKGVLWNYMILQYALSGLDPISITSECPIVIPS